MARIGAYMIGRLASGQSRFPLVLMLEPLFRCNLRCLNCGKVDYPADILASQLSVEECLDAAEECGAPVVSIPGGEPLLHPDMPRIARELAARKRFVYLCTNSLLVGKRIGEFTPSPYLTFNIHLDGRRERHDRLVDRPGVFDHAVEAVRLLVSKGFRVTTNTTLYKGDTPESVAAFLDFLSSLGVEGLTVAAGFGYENASDQELFMDREEARRQFKELFRLGRGRWRFNHSSLYLSFLAGERDYACSPWATPTRNIFGWQRPCYLLADGYAASYRELLEQTDWDRYGTGNDPRCADCTIHCGFEPSAVMDSLRRPDRMLRAAVARKLAAVHAGPA
jgi:hopanoid biosynthesis associated radical SAM protein HpnH